MTTPRTAAARLHLKAYVLKLAPSARSEFETYCARAFCWQPYVSSDQESAAGKRGGDMERRLTVGGDEGLGAAPALRASPPLLFDDDDNEQDFPLLPDAEEGDALAPGGRRRDKRQRRQETGGLWRGSGAQDPALHRGPGHDLFDMSSDSTSETISSSSSSPSA